jgi:hypothetical protein
VEDKTGADSAAQGLDSRNLTPPRDEINSRHEDKPLPSSTTISENVASLHDGENGKELGAALEEENSMPPSAPAYGVIRVTCLPAARAVINADTLGMADISPGYFQITAGEHWLTLINPRFPPYKKTVQVAAGDTVEFAISLWETVGILKLFVRPWAEVKIDDISFGKTPLGDIMLAPGEHTISLHHPDREVFVTTRRFFAGQRDTLSIDLRQKY